MVRFCLRTVPNHLRGVTFEPVRFGIEFLDHSYGSQSSNFNSGIPINIIIILLIVKQLIDQYFDGSVI